MTAHHVPWSVVTEVFKDAKTVLKWQEEMLADGGTHNFEMTWIECIDHNTGDKLCVAFLGNGPNAPQHAHVLAAAPELLNAAERLLEYLDQDVAGQHDNTITHGTRGRADELRDAIAKAKGGAR